MAAPWDGRLVTYHGSGAIASRPVTPNIAPGLLALWWATDTSILSLYESGAGWVNYSPSAAASAVSFTPSGGLSATDVQAALVELDAEKASTTSGSHIANHAICGGI